MTDTLGCVLAGTLLIALSFGIGHALAQRPHDYRSAAFFACVIIAIGLLAMTSGCYQRDCDAVAETRLALIETVESQVGVSCDDDGDAEVRCTGGIEVAVDSPNVARVFDGAHYPVKRWGAISCRLSCEPTCLVVRGGAE